MTIQSLWLLMRLKQAQRVKDAWFSFDTEANKISTACLEAQYTKTIKLKGYKNSLESTLEYLASKNYIALGSGMGRVLHGGWHWGQIIAGKFAAFLFRSIAVTVVVAFLTALVTLWLNLS